MNSELEKLSYSLGINIAANLKNQGLTEVDGLTLGKALNDAFGGANLEMTNEESAAFLNEYFSKLQAKKYEGNIKSGEEFLAANKKRDGVITIESGLQYEVLTEGSGQIPTLTDTVTTHYHGTLIDGTIFDSSVQRGTPASFPVNGVIQGWTQALKLMPLGSKWRLFVPYQLAYGERGAGDKIGPYTTLIFEVELLEIKQ